MPRHPRSTLFPYTTLFRSHDDLGLGHQRHAEVEQLLLTVGEIRGRSEEHTSELQSLRHLVCRLLLEKKNQELLDHPRAVALELHRAGALDPHRTPAAGHHA